MPTPVLTTPSTEQRATGLGGAIGCSFRQAHNDLIFVEFAGRLSRLSLVRPVAATVSSGTATLRGTWLFDFDAGHEGTSGDVWWEQHTATRRSLHCELDLPALEAWVVRETRESRVPERLRVGAPASRSAALATRA